MHLVFSYDFISPYAYLAWPRVRELAARTGAAIAYEPVLLAGLLGAWGQRGPAEIEPKRLYTAKDVARRAARRRVPLTWPATHPFNPLAALRVSQPEVAGDDQVRVIDALFTAIWAEGVIGQDAAGLAAALDRAGLDGAGLIARTGEPQVKQRLADRTAAAVARGVFGVPTLEVGDELFWGDDALVEVEAFLRGEDPIDAVAVRERARAAVPGAVRRP